MAARLAVEAPQYAPTSRTAGLLSYTENVHDVPRATGVAYLSTAICGPVGFAPGLCSPAAAITPDVTKTQSDWDGHILGDPFAVYRMVGCYLDGSDDYQAIAERSLAAGEGFAVESAVYTLILTASPSAAGTGTAVQVLAALDHYAAENIPAQPYLHVSTLGLYSLAKEGLLVRLPDGTLQTHTGMKVVAGAGYGLSDVTDTTFEMFVTGPIDLWRGEYILTAAQNRAENLQSALAERVYTATTECLPARGVAFVPDVTQP